jgi:hypothetical protein
MIHVGKHAEECEDDANVEVGERHLSNALSKR